MMSWIVELPSRLRLLWPVIKLAPAYLDHGDVWRSAAHPVPLRMFSPGCRQDFACYFEESSRVRVNVLSDICDWLADCEYVHDHTLFGRDDLWLHPARFEQIRKGDCEDHALWAWRKLCELGYAADFVVGEWKTGGEVGLHAWVVFEGQGGRFLLEGVTGDARTMIQPLDEVRGDYCPHVGVDHQLIRKMYSGFIRTLDRKRR